MRDGSKKVLWRKLNMVNIEKQHETLRLWDFWDFVKLWLFLNSVDSLFIKIPKIIVTLLESVYIFLKEFTVVLNLFTPILNWLTDVVLILLTALLITFPMPLLCANLLVRNRGRLIIDTHVWTAVIIKGYKPFYHLISFLMWGKPLATINELLF